MSLLDFIGEKCWKCGKRGKFQDYKAYNVFDKESREQLCDKCGRDLVRTFPDNWQRDTQNGELKF